VACWGGDGLSVVGAGPTTRSLKAVAVTGGALAGKTVTGITAYAHHVCAFASDSTMACWGLGDLGRLGDGTMANRTVPRRVVVAGTPLEGRSIVDLDVGERATCAVAADGTVACWGSGTLGNLGSSISTLPVAVAVEGTGLDGLEPVEVAVGRNQACARGADGSVACWGSGPLGDGTVNHSMVPVRVTTAGTPLAGDPVVAIDAGPDTTCARSASGGLACWGSGSYGQMGTGGGGISLVSVSVSTARTALAGRSATVLGLGAAGTACAADGEVAACWGSNEFGSLGATTAGFAPVPAPPLAGSLVGQAVTEVVGNGVDGCARVDTGGVHCWGSFAPGGPPPTEPVALPTGTSPLASSPAVDVAAAWGGACAVGADGSITCWGSNSRNQLGRPGTDSEPAAVDVAGTVLEGRQVVEVERGQDFTCARAADGTLACWGLNVVGQLGNGSAGTGLVGTPTPVAVRTDRTPLQGRTVIDLALADVTACALTSDSVIACWGISELSTGIFGQSSSVPVQLPTVGTVLEGKSLASLTMAEHNACATATDGTLGCWGRNDVGQVGNGSTIDAKAPVALWGPLSGPSVDQVVTGRQTCGHTTDGTLACAGSNLRGALGVGWSSAGSSYAIPVAREGTPLDGATVVGLSSLGGGVCALTDAGEVSCWGASNQGTVWVGVKPTGVAGLSAPVVDPTVADAPTAVAAVGSDGRATVSWTPPADDGGAAITGYVITPVVDGEPLAPIASNGPATSVEVWGLTNKVEHTFLVSARNAAGVGRRSGASNAVIPRASVAPHGSWGAFTDRLFVDLLGRKPTSGERAAWIAGLSAETAHTGELVAELRATPDHTTIVDPTVRLYRALLRRAPDAGGLRFWVDRRRTGSWSLHRMASAFSSSPEFQRRYGSLSNRAFVAQIYTDVLGRSPDPAGVAYWTAQLDAGKRTRGTVVVGFSESNEFKRKQRELTDVAVASSFLLGRAATVTETATWVARQQAGTSRAQLARELLGSEAYRLRIQGG
jgi:alpha-tubulin suppressor-like RCC1 family protein